MSPWLVWALLLGHYSAGAKTIRIETPLILPKKLANEIELGRPLPSMVEASEGIKPAPNKARDEPVHQSTPNDLLDDPELRSLQEKINQGAMAKKLLKDRLKKLSVRKAAEIHTRMGDSYKKLLPKLSGVRTKSRKSAKRRTEGTVKKYRRKLKPRPDDIKSGRASSPSAALLRRFFEAHVAKQVEVEPSDVVEELTESLKKAVNRVFSAGRSPMYRNIQASKYFKRQQKEWAHADPSAVPISERGPAFCRRCYKFFSTWHGQSPGRIYQYCCTVGHNRVPLDRPTT